MAESTEDNLALARYVAEAAQREVRDKARQRVPALRFGAVAGTLGALAAASTYRLNLLLLERKLPPEIAALVAAAAYTGGAGCAALLAARHWRGKPAPLPTETARQVAEIIADSS
ncbi:phage holin family protein [Actinomadura sp. SCN-SB]|uniref:phage holin family protein n=1 Tax=Actinomadura sp. SCN-SB TaxID=3373092 RepID=UPI00374FE8C4